MIKMELAALFLWNEVGLRIHDQDSSVSARTPPVENHFHRSFTGCGGYLLFQERLVLVLLLELLLWRRVSKHAAPGKLWRLDEGEACKKQTRGVPQTHACSVSDDESRSLPMKKTALQYQRPSHWAEAPPPGGLQGWLFFATAWGCCRPLHSACASGSGRLRGRNAHLEPRVQGGCAVPGKEEEGPIIPMRFPVLSLRGAPPPPRPHGWWLFISASSWASRHSASFLSRSRRSC